MVTDAALLLICLGLFIAAILIVAGVVAVVSWFFGGILEDAILGPERRA